MRREKFLQWQWRGYSAAHRNRTNLLLHLIAVPLFMAATLLVLFALITLSLSALAVAVLCFLVSLFLQGRGHKLEAVRPAPFQGAGNFLRRLWVEQWITFPRFVLSGGWAKNLWQARDDSRQTDPKRAFQ